LAAVLDSEAIMFGKSEPIAVGLKAAMLLLLVSAAVTSKSNAADEKAGIEFFEKKIRPILVRQCYECHSSAVAKPKGELLLDSRAAIRKGGESGPAVVPGNVEKSLLLAAIQYESFEMPPNKKLSADVIADFVAWVKLGAPDSRDKPSDSAQIGRELWQAQYQARSEWWSLQPVTNPLIPDPKNGAWSKQPIDRFILSRLEEHRLTPQKRADPTTLIRRLTYSLTGLPPTLEQLDRFKLDWDQNPDAAYVGLVDRLLSSRRFGEHWARHWMDVVRYTDTYGYEWDVPAKGAFHYRDYLIRAFNADVPFDQLIREQIAGDLLEEPRINSDLAINESLIGPMFFQMGEKRHGDSSEFNGIHQEMLDNKIDAFSKAFQATTIACARCHDHKLDAIAQTEYYALAGMFMSSRWLTRTVDLPSRNAAVFKKLVEIKQQLRSLMTDQWDRDLSRLGATEMKRLSNAAAKSNPKGIPLEHVLRVWHEVSSQPKDVASAWKKMRQLYVNEREKRKKENSVHFPQVIDFRVDEIPSGWSVDGVGLQDKIAVGDFVVALKGNKAVSQILPGGFFTGSLSPRLNGAIRTPFLNTLSNTRITFEAFGGDFAAKRTVYDNAFLTEKQQYLKNRHPQAISQSTLPAQKQRNIYIEFATKTSNPNFPPRVGLGGACSEKQAADPASWFGLTRVFLHNAARVPSDELDRFQDLFGKATPQDPNGAADQYVNWFRGAIERWSTGKCSPADVKVINWLLDNKLISNEPKENAQQLVETYRAVEKQIESPWTVNGMADIDPGFDYRLNIRGDYDQLGAAPARDFVQVIKNAIAARKTDGATTTPTNSATHSHRPRHSGRRELAEYIASPLNPLTARVFVNRVWLHLFGQGIVSTPNDFGHLGQQPSHPQLLDYLADRFIAEDWSTKKLIRSIVLSETWRQASAPSVPMDARNRLLHHFPFRRLEAESIRDAMLASSGRLLPDMFGPPDNPYRANEDAQKRLFRGPLDGNGRRSIYTKITIMEPPRFLAIFNQPKPKIPIGKRDVTNTPAQSLTLLNDPFVIGQAQLWAKTLVGRTDDTVQSRIKLIFQTAIGRLPTESELQRWSQAVRSFAMDHNVQPSELIKSLPVWQDITHAVFNMKEFIYIK
jgi:hypothetical protein